MLALLLGAAVLFLLVAGLRAFETASVTSVKSLLAWVAALGGLSLALMLLLTGKAGIALGGLTLFGPLIYQRWQQGRGRRPRRDTRMPPNRQAGMSRQEAYEVLGLRQGASQHDVREAHRRLMRAAHPDAGGSDWLAARINQARDVLIG